MSNATGENDSVKYTPWTCVYPLTKFLDFRRIKPSASSLLLNTHLTGTGFLPLAFMAFLFFSESRSFLIENYLLLISQKFSTNFHLASLMLPWGSQVIQRPYKLTYCTPTGFRHLCASRLEWILCLPLPCNFPQWLDWVSYALLGCTMYLTSSVHSVLYRTLIWLRLFLRLSWGMYALMNSQKFSSASLFLPH